jgi:6,7-dimethyl-8-ribityllumazine synthase
MNVSETDTPRQPARRYAVVASRYNDAIVSRLLAGAVECLESHGVAEADTVVVRVPGSFELPQAARRLAATRQFDAVICLGALIRGETSHFEWIASAVAHGITRAAEETGVPMSFGVLTTETLDQARERAGGKVGNKGWEAASAAMEMADLAERIDRMGRA